MPKEWIAGEYGHAYWLDNSELQACPMFVNGELDIENTLPVEEFATPLLQELKMLYFDTLVRMDEGAYEGELGDELPIKCEKCFVRVGNDCQCGN